MRGTPLTGTSARQQELIAVAREARERAIAPFSRFRVGAALETSDGRIYSGCNIENASYGLTVCAERVALLTALAAGDRAFKAIVVTTQGEEPTPPCGSCRQLLWEYTGDIDVLLTNLNGVTRLHRLSDLFPHPFNYSPEDR
jgi:cytidine deaminase